jgi:phosphoserine phosphatase RsbU/P
VSTAAHLGDGERLRRIEPILDGGLVHLSLDDLLAELGKRARDALDADTAAILLLEESGRYLVATAASGLEEEVYQQVRIPWGKGFAGRIAAENRPVVLDEVDASNVVNPILLDKGIRSLLGVPLTAEGKLVGVLHVGTLTPRRFTLDDVELLRMIADKIALAALARLSSGERAAARALQRSLLPSQFPDLDHAVIAARYLPSSLQELGGDWYDVFVLPDGHVGVAIGDAMGHGLAAAVVMSRLRSTLRAYAIESDDPADVITRVDRKMELFEPSELATMLYGIFDPDFSRVRLSSAGHPAPVLAQPGQSSTLLPVVVDPPVGTPQPRAPRRTTTIEVPEGALLVLYTDGLVERRDAELDKQLARLVATVEVGAPESVCTALTATFFAHHAPRDDVAILALLRRAVPDHGV